MIVNLVGPPGVGKTTFASRFVLEHPYWTFCPIDRYRLQAKNEDEAWELLEKDITENEAIVLETVGMGWRYKDLRERNFRDRPVLTVHFDINDFAQLQDRIRARIKRTPNYKYNEEDELAMAGRAYVELAREKSLPSIRVLTDEDTDPEKRYDSLCSAISDFRIRNYSGE